MGERGNIHLISSHSSDRKVVHFSTNKEKNFSFWNCEVQCFFQFCQDEHVCAEWTNENQISSKRMPPRDNTQGNVKSI